MHMGNNERLRLLDLRAKLSKMDPSVRGLLDKELRADPYVTNVNIQFTVVDPFLEICGDPENKDSGGYVSPSKLSRMLTSYVVEELDPAWWTPKWGASWWVRSINDQNPMPDPDSEERRAPGRTSKQSSYPDSEDAKLTFANVEEGLTWALSYIKANADDVRELLNEFGET